ncbi:hypothetical protein KJK34_04505 [Flavobacterium sp. D11R37]|uniref:tetratricopeptide repeat protein n=1 Tax=Flavobacterium coralii TaxID=2838017 RepID=UPI001CA72D3B|nr:hypothetical protein [Flavobacterium coralii]MBY8962007.1 hypothetical protein [Flavobacterium coralii]
MRYLILIYIVFVLQSCKAQDNDEDIALFSKGIALYELQSDGFDLNIDNDSTFKQIIKLRKNVLNKSHGYFSELIKKYPKSKLYFYALNNKAQIEYELEEYDSARDTYIEIINSKANDKESYSSGGFMGESYTNYKNRACIQLANIEHENKNFKEAIKYLDLTNKYPYQHFCGNAYASRDIYMAQQYAKNYSALGDTEKTLNYLLPYVFPDGLADNTELVNFTVEFLKKIYGTENIKRMFAAAKQTLKYKEPKNKKSYGQYAITFLDKEIIVPVPYSVYAEDLNNEMKEMSKAIDNSLISQQLE